MASFYEKTRAARKVLVLDLGFLGDTIHLMPALHAIRQAYPEAKLEVMVAEHIRDILQVCPWIDRVLGYPRYPKGPKWHAHGKWIRDLRRSRYDAVINLNGSDRSSFLTFLTGARHRLGRKPEDGGPWIWPYLFTDTVAMPRGGMPVYEQNCRCLELAGFPNCRAEFHVEFPAAARQRADALLPRKPGWIHVSPFANDDYKELPADVLIGALVGIREQRPQAGIVISSSGSVREREKMREFVKRLPFVPDACLTGDLSVLELAAGLQKSALHCGADSGALHVALMAGIPTVSWFREYEAIDEWKPVGKNHRCLIGKASDEGLTGINSEMVVAAARELLGAPQ